MRHIVFLVSIFLLAGPAHAASRTISLVNQSGDTILSASLMQEEQDPPVNPIALSSAVAAGDTGDMIIDLPDGQCVVGIIYQMANGGPLTQGNVDLCSVDGIVVE